MDALFCLYLAADQQGSDQEEGDKAPLLTRSSSRRKRKSRPSRRSGIVPVKDRYNVYVHVDCATIH